jgi:hypothetical protein
MKYWKTKVGLIASALIILVIVGGVVSQCKEDTYSLTRLKTRNNVIFDIRGQRFVEISQGILCRVIKDEEIIFETGIGVTTESKSLEFDLIESGDDLFAIVEKANPHVVFALFDVKKRKMWTSMTGPEYRAYGKELLQRLNENRTGKPFTLSRDDTLSHQPIQSVDGFEQKTSNNK